MSAAPAGGGINTINPDGPLPRPKSVGQAGL